MNLPANCLAPFLVGLALSTSCALAQEGSIVNPPTRTEQIDQARREKEARGRPDAPDKVERVFDKVDEFVSVIPAAAPAGIRPKFSSSAPGWGGLVPGSGFSFGPQFYHPNLAKGEMAFRASAIGTAKHNYLFDTQVTFPRAAGNRMIFDFLGRYKAERSINYYGPGPDSQRGSRTDFSRESSELNFRIVWKPVLRHVQVGVTGGALWVNVGPGIATGISSTEQLFGPATTPGIQQQTDFFRGGPFVQFDATDNPGIPRRGSRIRVSYDYYHDRKYDAYSFRLLQGVIEHYLPFFNEKRVIALRAKTSISYANPNQVIPFYLQQMVGGPNDLRGFRLFRFTDNNSLVLNGEYRWEVAPVLDMALFADGGKVFHRTGEFNLRNLESAGGFGFRFKSRSSVVVRLDVGFSREGFRIWFRTSDVY